MQTQQLKPELPAIIFTRHASKYWLRVRFTRLAGWAYFSSAVVHYCWSILQLGCCSLLLEHTSARLLFIIVGAYFSSAVVHYCWSILQLRCCSLLLVLSCVRLGFLSDAFIMDWTLGCTLVVIKPSVLILPPFLPWLPPFPFFHRLHFAQVCVLTSPPPLTFPFNILPLNCTGSPVSQLSAP